ncbi:MAG: FixH family protein [Spongiibacteraceae bacterium]
MQKSDPVVPWYKQFWPWFIFLLPASVVVAGIITVVIAFRHQDSIVADDYYQQGMGINRILAEDTMAEQLGAVATLKLDLLVGEVRVALGGNFAQAPAQLILKWIHPTSQDKDFLMTLKLSPNDDYLGQLTQAIDGRWYVELSAKEPQAWRLNAEAQLPANNSETEYVMSLTAAGATVIEE